MDKHINSPSLAPALDLLNRISRHGRALKWVGAVYLFWGGPAVAAEDQFFGEVPLVLTASRLAQTPYQAPAAVTVIDRETILASGFTELHDILRLVPGFLVADWAGGSPTVASHGLGDAFGRRIKVLIDGRTVNNALRGNVDWQDLPVRVDDLERVEVVRGPDGAVYGANAFQGVVQFITRSPKTETGNAAVLRGGNNGFHDLGLRLNGTTAAGLDWRATVSRRRADNFEVFDEGGLETIERSVANLQGVLQLNNNDEFRFFAGATEGYNRTGIPLNPGDPVRRVPLRENHLQLAWQRSFGPESELILQYAHQDHATSNSFDVQGPGLDLFIDKDVEMRRDELDFQLNHRFSPQWQALAGMSLRRDAVRSRYFFDHNGDVGGTQYQVFGNVAWNPVRELTVNVGGTWEDHYTAGQLFSPRLALNYAFSPFSVLRLSTGTAYRAPTVQESESFQVVHSGNEIIDIGTWSRLPLEAERVKFLELGYVGGLPELGLSGDLRVFHEEYDNYIDEQRCRYNLNASRLCTWPRPPWLVQNRNLGPPDTVFLVNAGSVRIDGVEFHLDWRKPGWGRVLFNQAFIDVDELRPNSDPDLVLTAPTSLSSVLLIKELPDRWNASLGFYYATRMYWLNDGDVVPSNGRTDLRIAKRFGPADQENEIAFTMQSIEGDYTDFHEGRYKHQSFAFVTLKLAW